MPPRASLVAHIASLVGPTFRIEDPRNGWPAFASIEVDCELIPTAIYVGEVHGTHRGNPAERRFQNPGRDRPILEYRDRVTVLLGLWDEDDDLSVPAPVLVLPEPERRIGRDTRWSMFVSIATLLRAAENGWATKITASDEHLVCFHPELLPLAIASLIARVHPDEREVQTAVRATGHLNTRRPTAAGRVGSAIRLRRAVSALIRDTWFSGDVLDAYERRCAMCGLGLNLVQGAHIYPASAPGSRDVTSNGVALCANHHLAFDRHQIAVIPPNLDVLFRPDVLDQARRDPVALAFVSSTFDFLNRPHRGAEPDPEMLMLRYQHFADKYDWLTERW
ncbi:HNH endonuclease [Agromyces sp. NPDC004153]